MSAFSKFIKPIKEKMKHSIPLTEAEMILLLIEKMFLIGWSGGFALRYKRAPKYGDINKIVVIQLTSIGDVVYTTPLLSALRERYGEAKISFLVEEGSFEVVKDNPYINEVILFRREHYVERIRQGEMGIRDVAAELFKFIKELQRKSFDLAINLHAAPRAALLTHLLHPKNINGITVDECGRPIMCGSVWILYKHYITCNKLLQSVSKLDLVELYLKIGGVNPSTREMNFTIPQRVKEKCNKEIDSILQRDEVLIGISPGANYKARRWEKEKFARVADLLSRNGAKVLIFGGAGEVGLVQEIVDLMQTSPINLAGKTTLSELAAYISRCDYFITNDSGPMHIAGAMKTKTVAICGPTRTGPYGAEGHLLLQADLPCVGCGPTSKCRRGKCMKEIDVEDVLEALKFQSGKITTPPALDGVNLFTSGKEKAPGRLFSYYPLVKKKKSVKVVRDHILGLVSLNLWIQENNKLSYQEPQITKEEVKEELSKHYLVEDIKEGLKKYREILKRWMGKYKVGFRLLLEIKSEHSEGKLKALLNQFNKLDKTTNRGLIRLLNFYDVLYPKEEKSLLDWKLFLYRKKIEACEYLLNFCLEP